MIITNVRKKGRPRFLSEDEVAIMKTQFPDDSLRQVHVRVKAAFVWKVLIKAAGDEYSTRALAHDAKSSRPKTFRRFLWLMGNKIQHVVLSELYGMSDAEIVKTADFIEQQRREKGINAKTGRRIARTWRQCGFGMED